MSLNVDAGDGSASKSGAGLAAAPNALARSPGNRQPMADRETGRISKAALSSVPAAVGIYAMVKARGGGRQLSGHSGSSLVAVKVSLWHSLRADR
jgi:hypothetical protein